MKTPSLYFQQINRNFAAKTYSNQSACVILRRPENELSQDYNIYFQLNFSLQMHRKLNSKTKIRRLRLPFQL